MSKNGNRTFMKITNNDIYKKLSCIDKKVSRINGDVKLNKWIAGTAMTIALMAIGISLKSGIF